MRILWLLGSLAVLSACSSYSIHCNKHLRPINVPDRTTPVTESRGTGLPASASGGVASGKP